MSHPTSDEASETLAKNADEELVCSTEDPEPGSSTELSDKYVPYSVKPLRRHRNHW